MKTIYKYEVPGVVQMPASAKVLGLQEQGDKFMIWVLIDLSDDQILENRKFKIIGTGWEFDDAEKRYVGTVQKNGFVWHLFEEILR